MKTSIHTAAAPVPLACYSQAVRTGNTIYVSAMLAHNMATGQLLTGDIETETRQVLDNIKSILAAAGTGFEQVVKCSIFLKDMADYNAMNSVYATYVSQPYPARETIQVSGLPMNVNIEISAIAVL